MPSSSARVALRADGCEAIGAGHVTRCRSLADALRRRGAAVRFVLSEQSDQAHAAALAADGFDVCVIAGGPLRDLGAGDAAETVAAARAWRASALLVDHYGADPGYLAELRAAAPVGVIDDLGDRDLGGVDWILNQNLGARPGLYGPAGDRTILLGTAYALLRPQFAGAAESVDRAFAPDDARVLVTFGGGAPPSLYVAALNELAGAGGRLEVRVVLGRDDAPGDDLARAAAQSPHAVALLGRVEDMASSIVWADVVLSAGGSTCWELLALGAPAVVTALSPDQEPNAEALAAAGCAVAVPADLAGAGAAVTGLLADPAFRARASRHGRALVDGRGADRAAASLLETLTEETLHAVA